MKYIISYSGGKDSTAALLYLYEQFPADQIDVAFCDTGWETKTTYDYVEFVEKWCNEKGIGFYRIVPPLQFEELVKQKGFPPLVRARYCTSYLKIKPMQMFHSRYREIYPDFTIVVGERAEESPSRAKKPEKEFDDKYSHADIWRPLLRWTATEVFEFHKKHNFPINPMYRNGFTRVGCSPCIFARQADIVNIFKQYPEQIEKVREIEKVFHEKTGDKPSFFGNGKTIDETIAYCSRKTAHGCIEDFLPEDSVCPAHYAILCE